MRRRNPALCLLVGLTAGCAHLPGPPLRAADDKVLASGRLEFGRESGGQEISPIALSLSTSSDYVAAMAGTYVRFVTSTWKVANYSGRTLRNPAVHAYVPTGGNLQGTPFTALSTADNHSITDPTMALRLIPTHAMEPGFLAPRVSEGGAGFQAYSREESLGLEAAAISAGVLQPGDKVLDYGFAINASGGAIPSGGSGTLTISYRLPVVSRASAPFFMEAAFLVTEESEPRVTRSLEEGSDVTGVLERARELPGARVVLLGSPSQAEIDSFRAAGHEVQVVEHALLSTDGTSMP